MVIIKILGGLASQIGKYSFGYGIAKGLNTELVLDISDYLNGYFPELSVVNLYRIIQTNTMRLLGIDPNQFESMINEVIENIGKYDFSHIKLLE